MSNVNFHVRIDKIINDSNDRHYVSQRTISRRKKYPKAVLNTQLLNIKWKATLRFISDVFSRKQYPMIQIYRKSFFRE